jgi:hypothetical protein
MGFNKKIDIDVESLQVSLILEIGVIYFSLQLIVFRCWFDPLAPFLIHH